ncbi:hypothetical protein [Allosphingosinicella sp.]|uniref:hypothetical protein n=1 Tax=Allosphingosinicella sp. TaxID=2823234 RepID=UPI002FC16193
MALARTIERRALIRSSLYPVLQASDNPHQLEWIGTINAREALVIVSGGSRGMPAIDGGA